MGHTLLGKDTHSSPRTQEEGAGCSEAWLWAVGRRLFVLSLYHTLRTPAKEVITLLSQNGFWPRVKKSSCFLANQRQINLRSLLELLIRSGGQGASGCQGHGVVLLGLWEEVAALGSQEPSLPLGDRGDVSGAAAQVCEYSLCLFRVVILIVLFIIY